MLERAIALGIVIALLLLVGAALRDAPEAAPEDTAAPDESTRDAPWAWWPDGLGWPSAWTGGGSAPESAAGFGASPTEDNGENDDDDEDEDDKPAKPDKGEKGKSKRGRG